MNDTNFTSSVLNCTNCSDSSLSPSSTGLILSLATVVTLTLINSVCCVVGVFGNGLVLLAIVRNPTLRSVPDLLIFSLSLADLIVTAIYLPLYISNVLCYQTMMDNTTFRMTKSFVGHLAMLASIAGILGITIDRLTAIRWPLRYPKLITKKFAFTYIPFAWLLSAAIATAYSFFKPDHLFLSTYCLVLLLTTIVMYSYILKIANRVAHVQRKRMQTMRYREEGHQNQETENYQVERKFAKIFKERKAVKTFAIVIGVFVITWIPLIVYTIVVSKEDSSFRSGFLWVETFSLWNSFINPFIYFARSKRYRTMALHMLGLRQWLRSRRISSERTRAATISGRAAGVNYQRDSSTIHIYDPSPLALKASTEESLATTHMP